MPQTSTEIRTAAAPAAGGEQADQRGHRRRAGRPCTPAAKTRSPAATPTAPSAATSSSATDRPAARSAEPGQQPDDPDRVAGGDQQRAADEGVRQRVAAERRAGGASPYAREAITPAEGEQHRHAERDGPPPPHAGPAASTASSPTASSTAGAGQRGAPGWRRA